MKFVIAEVDFVPELGRKQDVCFLMDLENNLMAAESVELAQEKVKKTFGRELEVGQEFFENEKGEKYYFANMKIGALPEGWRMVSYRELDAESCGDYEAIMVAVEKLGYIADCDKK